MNDGSRLVLAPGERKLLEVERNLLPYWFLLAFAGLGLVAYGMSDPVYGWSTFFLGIIGLSLVGGAITSVRYHVTDRRLIRTGYLGVRDVPLDGARVTRRAHVFGEIITVENGSARLRILTAREGPAVERILRQAKIAA